MASKNPQVQAPFGEKRFPQFRAEDNVAKVVNEAGRELESSGLLQKVMEHKAGKPCVTYRRTRWADLSEIADAERKRLGVDRAAFE
eukprot:2094316-Karenia_brevis.AAC.1